MSLLAYYMTLGSMLELGQPKQYTHAAQFSGAGYLYHAGITWDNYKGPFAIEYDIWLNEIDVIGSSVFHFGSSFGATTRLQTHHTWTDKRIYFDALGNSTTSRISTPYTGYFGRWVSVRLESSGELNTSRKIILDGVEVATASTSLGIAMVLSGLFIGRYSTTLWKGWLRNMKVWQNMNLLVDAPFGASLKEFKSGSNFGVFTSDFTAGTNEVQIVEK